MYLKTEEPIMHDALIRTEMLLGADHMKRLRTARVAVFGIGGVGSYAVEALARSGIGNLDLIDNDLVAASNRKGQGGNCRFPCS